MPKTTAVAGLVVLVARAVERDRAVGAGGLARLEHLLERDAQALGDLGGRRGAAQLARELLAERLELDGQLLQVARDAHRPALVAEVTLELAEDGRDGEARERGLAARVEAVDRLQQAERRDLDEVVERLAAALVAARELARERQEALHERLARGGVAAMGALEQRAVGARPGRPAVVVAGICSRRACADGWIVEMLQEAELVQLRRVRAGGLGRSHPSGGGLGRGAQSVEEGWHDDH